MILFKSNAKYLAILLFLSFQAASSQEACFNLFKIERPQWQNIYEDVDFSASERDISDGRSGRTLKQGYVHMRGLRTAGELGYELIGGIEYTIKNNSLTLTRWHGNPEFAGQMVFKSLMRYVLNRHPNIETIMTSISGSYYEQYLRSLAVTKDTSAAIRMNDVYQQLADLGYSVIQRFGVMKSGDGTPFVRLFVRWHDSPNPIKPEW